MECKTGFGWGLAAEFFEVPSPRAARIRMRRTFLSSMERTSEKGALERVNLATTESHPRKSPVRSSVSGARRAFSAPRSARLTPRRSRFGGRERKFLAVRPDDAV